MSDIRIDAHPTAYSRALEGCLLAAAFLVPLVLLQPFRSVFDGADPKATLFYILMLAAAALWTMDSFTQRRVIWRQTPLDLPVAAFLAWNLASLLWSRYDYATLAQCGRYFSYAAYGFAVATYLRGLRQIQRMLVATLGSATLTCLYGVIQLTGHDWIKWSPPDVRILSSLGNPTFFAAYLLLLLPLTVNLSLGAARPRLSWSLAALSLLMFLCLLGTYTRAAWLALAVTSALDAILVWRYGRLSGPAKRVAAAIGIGLVLVAAGFSVWGPVRLTTRLASSFQMDLSNQQRVKAWEAGLGVWKEHLLLGTGAGTFYHEAPEKLDPNTYSLGNAGAPGHAHNELLEQAADTGLVGLALFLAVLGATAARAWRLATAAREPLTRLLSAGLLCGGLGLMAQNLTGVSLRDVTGAVSLWWALGMVGALGANELGPAVAPPLPPRSRSAQAGLGVLLLGAVVLATWPIGRFLISEIKLAEGLAAQTAGREAEARRKLEEALRLNYYSLRARSVLAVMDLNAGQPQAALDRFLALQRLAPNYSHLDVGMAAAEIALGRPAPAVRLLQRARQQENSPSVLLALAEAQAAAGQGAAALATADEAVALFEGGLPYPHIQGPELYWRRAQLRAKLGKRQGAVTDAERALALAPRDPLVHMMVGEMYRGLKDWARAEARYQTAIDLAPQDPQGYVGLGLTQAEAGQWEQAVGTFATARLLAPQDPFPALHLGLAYQHLGRTEEARRLLAAVAALGPGHPLGAQARQALDQLEDKAAR